MYILGISAYAHESSCALLKDGRIIAHAEEERFNRERHTWKFPENSIRFCLSQAGVSIDEVERAAFFWQPKKEIGDNLGHFLRYFPKSLNLLTAPSGHDDMTFYRRIRSMRNVGQEIETKFGRKLPMPVDFVEHHLAHAASAFFSSEFEDSAILTLDGRGESTSTLLSHGEGSKIRKLKEVSVPHSLGHFYAAITHHLGFRPFHDEWKVMGMSAYGRDTFVGDFDNVLLLKSNGTFELNLEYFSFHTHGQARWLSDKFKKKFGDGRNSSTEPGQHQFDIAFALQRAVEKAGVSLANHLYQISNSQNLCVAGGVALNCLMNSRIVAETPFKNFYFQPISNDAGTSFGAAQLLHGQTSGNRPAAMNSIYLGPEFSDSEVLASLQSSGLNFYRSTDLTAEVARKLAEGKIVGWFQGRMESGPRALGNRSILADPTQASMKDKLNRLVKRREGFRPFAPSVLEEKCGEYFDLPKNQNSPYMMLTATVRPEKRAQLPAITHADGTARVQTVSKAQNLKFWQLLSDFGKIRGVPVLLNTSFNENEPIVCEPSQAIECFARAGLDLLVIGEYIVAKDPAGKRS